MNKLTKAWLQQTIAAMESQRDEAPFGISDDHDMTLAAMKMALAGMETTHNSVIAEQLDHVLSGMDVTAHQRAVISCAVDRLNKNAELLQQAPQPLTTSERAELENYRNDVPEDYFASLVTAARIRADKAMLKFPQPNYVLNKVAEESGEVIKAVIHFTEGREQWENVEAELIDNLAMLIRLVKEGDQVIGFTPPEACRAAMQPASDMAAQLESALLHIAELEAAPPAPVGYGETPVPLMPDFPGRTLTQRECYRAGFEAASVQHGWVACSERMPENDDFVYIWPRPDFGVELHVAQYGKFDKRDAGWYAQVYEQNYGIEYYPIKITHWMPLPAAPQREVDNG